MNSSSSGGKLEKFFAGKGFYIVLFLCAAVIGVSAWMLTAGNRTMKESIAKNNDIKLENKRVETVVITPMPELLPEDVFTEVEPEAPVINDNGLNEVQQVISEMIEDHEPEIDAVQVWHEGDVIEPVSDIYGWPVMGELERTHSMDTLSYDVTMHDWRTHDGIDIASQIGTTVFASHAGTVESITNDAMYGTVVVIDHGDGIKSIYANLADMPAVSVGDWVECGSVIGSVSDTAICEVGQGTHLHFAMTKNGESVDPMDYLPA